MFWINLHSSLASKLLCEWFTYSDILVCAELSKSGEICTKYRELMVNVISNLKFPISEYASKPESFWFASRLCLSRDVEITIHGDFAEPVKANRLFWSGDFFGSNQSYFISKCNILSRVDVTLSTGLSVYDFTDMFTSKKGSCSVKLQGTFNSYKVEFIYDAIQRSLTCSRDFITSGDIMSEIIQSIPELTSCSLLESLDLDIASSFQHCHGSLTTLALVRSTIDAAILTLFPNLTTLQCHAIRITEESFHFQQLCDITTDTWSYSNAALSLRKNTRCKVLSQLLSQPEAFPITELSISSFIEEHILQQLFVECPHVIQVLRFIGPWAIVANVSRTQTNYLLGKCSYLQEIYVENRSILNFMTAMADLSESPCCSTLHLIHWEDWHLSVKLPWTKEQILCVFDRFPNLTSFRAIAGSTIWNVLDMIEALSRLPKVTSVELSGLLTRSKNDVTGLTVTAETLPIVAKCVPYTWWQKLIVAGHIDDHQEEVVGLMLKQSEPFHVTISNATTTTDFTLFADASLQVTHLEVHPSIPVLSALPLLVSNWPLLKEIKITNTLIMSRKEKRLTMCFRGSKSNRFMEDREQIVMMGRCVTAVSAVMPVYIFHLLVVECDMEYLDQLILSSLLLRMEKDLGSFSYERVINHVSALKEIKMLLPHRVRDLKITLGADLWRPRNDEAATLLKTLMKERLALLHIVIEHGAHVLSKQDVEECRRPRLKIELT